MPPCCSPSFHGASLCRVCPRSDLPSQPCALSSAHLWHRSLCNRPTPPILSTGNQQPWVVAAAEAVQAAEPVCGTLSSPAAGCPTMPSSLPLAPQATWQATLVSECSHFWTSLCQRQRRSPPWQGSGPCHPACACASWSSMALPSPTVHPDAAAPLGRSPQLYP